MPLPSDSASGREALRLTRRRLLGRLRNWEDQASWREFFDTYWRFILEACERWLGQAPRFAKYHPAPRLGTRRVENRLLRRLALTAAESAR